MCAALVFNLAPATGPAQKIVRVGYVDPTSPSTGFSGVTAFWNRLRELGWVEGQNLVAARSWAEGRIDKLPALMAEVVGRHVDVIVTYGTPSAIAARNATSTVPIVVASMGDPVGSGLAASLAHPAGNLTGLSLGWADVGGKWLQLLQETIPRLSTVGVIGDPGSPMSQAVMKELEQIAPTRGMKVRFFPVHGPEELDHIFDQAQREAQAVLVPADPLTLQHRARITALAARYRLPGIYPFLEFMDSGGLMAYGVDSAVMFRRAADYVDKILRGARPADLPIEQPTQWTLAVNLKTARALGLTIPKSILVRADKVMR
jgi:putative ABC transport system substrate-binding protein